MYKTLIFIFFILLITSCSDNGTNVTKPEKVGKVVIKGDTNATIISNNGQFINSTSSNQYSTFQFYITEGTEVTTVLLRIKDYQSNEKEFDLSRDNNFSSVSFYSGATAYHGYTGTFKILERSPTRVKATFQFKAKKLGDPSKEIEVVEGLFDF